MRSIPAFAGTSLLLCATLLLPVSAPADMIVETPDQLSVSSRQTKTGGEFVVAKTSTEEGRMKGFIARKAPFRYTVTLLAMDPATGTEERISSCEKSAAVPAGAESITINADAYVRELRPRLTTSGYVQLSLIAPEKAGYTVSGSDSLEVFNETYRKEAVDAVMDDPQLMERFGQDYQAFVTQHQDLPPENVNREFIRKFPQYKKIMPAE